MKRRPGKRVQLTQIAEPVPTPLAGTPRGKGVSGKDGVYKTAVPYGKSHVNHFLQPIYQDLKPINRPLYARKRTRACFVAATDCGDSLFFPDPQAYLPFHVQPSDSEMLGIEEWRRSQLVSTTARESEEAGRPPEKPKGAGKKRKGDMPTQGDASEAREPGEPERSDHVPKSSE